MVCRPRGEGADGNGTVGTEGEKGGESEGADGAAGDYVESV